MQAEKRKKLVLAMEMLINCVNDESLINSWLMCGVADGDISPYSTDTNEVDDYYIKDENFKDLLSIFCRTMSRAWNDGGLFVDGITSRDKND